MVFSACFYSSYSLAYDQQYQVGGKGPNGGVVTSVDVTSVLTDQITKQVGDFEEKTYTYTYTEMVIEDVTSTQQVTTTTYETVETTTDNLLLQNPNKTTSGGILDHTNTTSTTSAGHVHTDYTGGSIQWTNDLSDFMTTTEIQNGFSVTGSANVYACENHIGGHCTSGTLDTFTITLKVIDPDTGLDTQKTSSWAVGYSTQNYSTTLDVSTNTYGENTQLISTFYGIDNGYWGGWYGPLINNPSVSVTYDQMQAVLTTIEQTIINSIQSSLDTIESEITQTYNPIIQPGTDTTTTPDIIKVEEPKAIEIKMESNSGTTMAFEVKVETTPTGTVNVSMADSTGKVEQIAEIKPLEVASAPEPKVEIKMETKSESTSSSTTKTETKTETTTAKTETKQESSKEEKKEDSKDNKKESKEDSKESKTTTVAEAKQKVAAKILANIISTTDAILINDTKLGLMIALADTENFAKYQAKQNQDLAQWYLNEGIYQDQKMLEDPYSVLYNLANDKLHDELTDLQYNYKYQ